MQPKRRSGRIAKELPIVLMGTDTTGKVFAEETTTVVLSRHGAGIVSRYRFAPDEVMILRLPSAAKEAEVRLVGQIGGEPGRYVYGLTFLDPQLEFWPMQFPPPENIASASHAITLECTFCQARQSVEHGEIEEDVYSVNGRVLRFCNECGTSTPWTKAREESASPASPDTLEATPRRAAEAHTIASPAAASLRTSPFTPPAPAAPPTIAALAPAPAPSASPVPFAPSAVQLPAASAAPAEFSGYSSAALEVLTTAAGHDVALAELPPAPLRAPAPPASDGTQPPQRPVDASGRPLNRRKYLRVRVSFSACVRGEFGDDVVACENVSKGGLCFHSRQNYALGAAIEVAAPFSPGEPAQFVPAKICRAEPLGSGLFRYGAAYTPPAASF